MKNLLPRVAIAIFILICAGILLLSLRGIPGNPSTAQLNTKYWGENGPFESSPERGRFALIYSLIEDKSFHFSIPLARFTTPDVGITKDGTYVSLFPPTLSIIASVGYIVGKVANASQVGTYGVIALFALLNVLLIRAIAIELGASRLAATIASAVFLFATPAFTYAVSLYQHHVSLFFILISVYLLLKRPSWWSLAIILFLCTASITIDFPNFFLMFPLGAMALSRIITIRNEEKKLTFTIKPLLLLTIITAIIPLLMFFWFNKQVYNNPFQVAGGLRSVDSIDAQGKPVFPKALVTAATNSQDRHVSAFFQSRAITEGLYIHLFSPDRGIFMYAPVILLGLFGGFILYKKRPGITVLLVSICVVNILLYSMWGDPWGGWAFGSRYLIPSYGILAIFLAFVLTSARKNILFLSLFLLLTIYCVGVNSLGALTTNSLPPKVQVLELEKVSHRQEKYTYMRNWDYLRSGFSKSFIFQAFAKRYLTAQIYWQLITGLILFTVGGATIALYILSKKESYEKK